MTSYAIRTWYFVVRRARLKPLYIADKLNSFCGRKCYRRIYIIVQKVEKTKRTKVAGQPMASSIFWIGKQQKSKKRMAEDALRHHLRRIFFSIFTVSFLVYDPLNPMEHLLAYWWRKHCQSLHAESSCWPAVTPLLKSIALSTSWNVCSLSWYTVSMALPADR
jgi:hypothetical protein